MIVPQDAGAASLKEKRKMRPGGGKSKGNGFESTVAKQLSTALSPLNFIRTQGSGARVGGKNFDTIGQLFGEDALKIFVGDVVPVNEKKAQVAFHHCIECKFYKTPDSFTALTAGTANIFKWYKEAVDDAAKVNKNPLLIFKWNRTPIFVAFDTNHKECPSSQLKPLLTLLKYDQPVALDIYHLEDLLKDTNFWYCTNGN